MRKLIQKLFMAGLMAFALLISGYAQTTDTAGFTVRAILPKNQADGDNTYFDLRVEPGTSQDLKVEVHNVTDTPTVLDISLHAASTNRNGIIEYLIENDPDETMRFPFNTIAETEQEITLNPNEQKQITVRINMPPEQFDGTVLGGIIIAKRLEEEQSEGMGINNRFSYVIGVRLAETDKVISPDFDLKSVQETLINYRTAVVANIRNLEPVIINDARTSAQIYKDGSVTPLFSVDKTDVDFAPNSVFPMPVEWEGQRMQAGDYRMSVQLDHQGEVWNWDHNFTISAAQANELNNAAIPKEPGMFPSALLRVLLIFLILILIVAAFYIGRKSKRSRSYDQN